MSLHVVAGAGDQPAPADYVSLGWALVRAEGKRPLGKDWQRTKPGADLSGWDGNFGVVLGASGLYTIVEYDTEQAGEKLIELLDAELPTTPIAQSGSGRLQLYFRDDAYQHATRGGLELRAGAHFMVLPPSRHPNGTPYKWLLDPRAFDLEAVPEAVLAYFTKSRPNGSTSPSDDVIRNGERKRARHCDACRCRCRSRVARRRPAADLRLRRRRSRRSPACRRGARTTGAVGPGAHRVAHVRALPRTPLLRERWAELQALVAELERADGRLDGDRVLEILNHTETEERRP